MIIVRHSLVVKVLQYEEGGPLQAQAVKEKTSGGMACEGQEKVKKSGENREWWAIVDGLNCLCGMKAAQDST